jgi:hypothetical protein
VHRVPKRLTTILAVTFGLGVIPTGAAADGLPVLPAGIDVPLALSPAGTAAYQLPYLGGAALTVNLQSGDVGMTVHSQDQSYQSQNSLSGAGTTRLVFQGSDAAPLELDLSTSGGAQVVLHVAAADDASPSEASPANLSTSSSSTGSWSSSTSTSTVSVNQQVTVSGGSAAGVSGGHIQITNGRVVVSGGQ